MGLRVKAPSSTEKAEARENPPWRRVAEWLRVLVEPGANVELRCLGVVRHGHKASHSESHHYCNDGAGMDGMAQAVLDITARSEGVYWTLNPLDVGPSLEGRPSRADDVLSRRWLLIDADPVRMVEDGQSKHCSSTEAEKAASLAVLERVKAELSSQGWPEPVVADSGNGHHLLYRIDLPADDGGLVKRVLVGLASKYDTDAVKIDRRLFDPSRICKLYGTMSRKGPDTAERPHRTSSILSLPAELTVVVRELLEGVAAKDLDNGPIRKERGTVDPPAAPEAVRPDAIEGDGKPSKKKGGLIAKAGRTDVRSRAEQYAQTCQPAVSGEGGHGQTLKMAIAIGPGFDLTEDDAYRVLADHYNPRCVPPWSEKDLRRKVREAYKVEANRGWQLRVVHRTDAPTGGDGHDGGETAGTAGTAGNEKSFDPFRIARAVLDARFGHEPSRFRTLVYWRDEWHRWHRGAWRVVSDRELDSILVGLIKTEVDRLASEDGGKPIYVTSALLTNVRLCLRRLCLVESLAVPQQPVWLTDGGEDGHAIDESLGDPIDYLSASNAVVHLPSLVDGRPCTFAPTPRFFSPTNLGYEFDPGAAPPEAWLSFLHSLWDDDPESISCLQEWFGYLLVPDTSQAKMLFLIGPKRSGKGTILRTIEAMVGSPNCAAPTLSSLATPFGVAPLIGKQVAMVGDARLSGRADGQAIVERLLSISGQDPQTIDRKHLSSWTGYLSARFVLASNELPRLADASGAFASRVVLLQMTRTFIDREDRALSDKIRGELPGVLWWAVQGWRRLRDRGHFIQPASGREILDDLQDLSSPISAFVADECVLGADCSVPIQDLFKRWKTWCESKGKEHPGDEAGFGRQLRAAQPQIKTSRPRDGSARVRIYVGIGLENPEIGSEPGFF